MWNLRWYLSHRCGEKEVAKYTAHSGKPVLISWGLKFDPRNELAAQLQGGWRTKEMVLKYLRDAYTLPLDLAARTLRWKRGEASHSADHDQRALIETIEECLNRRFPQLPASGEGMTTSHATDDQPEILGTPTAENVLANAHMEACDEEEAEDGVGDNSLALEEMTDWDDGAADSEDQGWVPPPDALGFALGDSRLHVVDEEVGGLWMTRGCSRALGHADGILHYTFLGDIWCDADVYKPCKFCEQHMLR